MYKNHIREKKMAFIKSAKNGPMRCARHLLLVLSSKHRKMIPNALYSMSHARHVPSPDREIRRVHESVYSPQWRDGASCRKYYSRKSP